MEVPPKKKFGKIDVPSLPKEVIFQLLLQLEPHEIKEVCFSKNYKVRKVCNSGIFQEAYKNKHYGLLKGKIYSKYDLKTGDIFLKDEEGNTLEIKFDPNDKKMTDIKYTPFKQKYYHTIYRNFDLRSFGPLLISSSLSDAFGLSLFLDRENYVDDEYFNYQVHNEQREFLEYINREKWAKKEKTGYFMTSEGKKDFMEEVVEIFKKIPVGDKNLLDYYYPKL